MPIRTIIRAHHQHNFAAQKNRIVLLYEYREYKTELSVIRHAQSPPSLRALSQGQASAKRPLTFRDCGFVLN